MTAPRRPAGDGSRRGKLDADGRPAERRGPKPIGELLGKVLARYGYGRTTPQLELESAWKAVAGPALAGRTRVGALRRGELEILVDTPALLQDLEFDRTRLQEGMQQLTKQSRIDRLRFRRA